MSGAITAGTIAAVAGIGAAGSIASGVIGANAAGNAASAQASAANNAAQLQSNTAANSLAFQQQQYNTSQQEMQPWLQSGAGAISNLDYLMGISPQNVSGSSAASPGTNASYGAPGSASATPQSSAVRGMSVPGGASSQAQSSPVTSGIQGLTASPAPSTFQATAPGGGQGSFGSLMTPYSSTAAGSFQAPTGLTMQNDPGYQARLQLGTQALQQSAAARGDVVTGGTANDLNQYAQNFASNEYGNVYNRALQTYNQGYNQYVQGQTQQYNQLAGLSGVGQQAAQQLSTAGQQAANTSAQTAGNAATQVGQDYQNAGAANASGYVGAANAINNGIGGATGNLTNLMLLNSLNGGGQNAGLGTGNQGQLAINTTPSAYNGLA